jgi:membrane-bound lytic murein transglycosylase D
MGTTDIATILRQYKSRSFGFASRNFYVSFLAALAIDREPARYFPGIARKPEMASVEVEMPAFIPVAALTRQLGIGRDELQQLNPALLPAVWSGQQYVPRGYRLRLPADAAPWSPQRLAMNIAPEQQFSAQPRPPVYKVRAGDTLSGVAVRNGLSTAQLATLNGLSAQARLRVGQNLKLPAPQGASRSDQLAGARDQPALVAQAEDTAPL